MTSVSNALSRDAVEKMWQSTRSAAMGRGAFGVTRIYILRKLPHDSELHAYFEDVLNLNDKVHRAIILKRAVRIRLEGFTEYEKERIHRGQKRIEEFKHLELYKRLSGLCRRYIAKPIPTLHETVTAQIALGPKNGVYEIRQKDDEGRMSSIVMEQKTMTLGEYIDGKYNTPAMRSFFVKQIARALICFHNVGALHNDFKPDNIVVTFTDDKTRRASLAYSNSMTADEKVRINDLCIKNPLLYLIDLGNSESKSKAHPLFGYDATNQNFLDANIHTMYENPENAFINRHAVRPIPSHLPGANLKRKRHIVGRMEKLHDGLPPANHLPVVYMRLLRDQAKRYAAKFIERVRSSKKASNATKEAVERTVANLLQGAVNAYAAELRAAAQQIANASGGGAGTSGAGGGRGGNGRGTGRGTNGRAGGRGAGRGRASGRGGNTRSVARARAAAARSGAYCGARFDSSASADTCVDKGQVRAWAREILPQSQRNANPDKFSASAPDADSDGDYCGAKDPPPGRDFGSLETCSRKRQLRKFGLSGGV
eukprot:6198886-Pleurochrysis_carterae.AAC.1